MKEREEQGAIKTKLLKITEVGERIKDIVIGTEEGEQLKAEKRRIKVVFSCQMLLLHYRVRQRM